MKNDQLSWIDEQQISIIETLRDLSEINSGTTNIQGLSRVHDEMEKLFAPICDTKESIALSPKKSIDDKAEEKNIEYGNLLRFVRRPQAQIKILLCGHMDTVFPADHPFQSTRVIDDHYLHGPGVADMKGGILTMLLALQAWEQSPMADLLGWEVLLNPDEETGSLASASYISESAKRNHLGLVYEPALEDGTLAGFRKGSGNFTLVVHGISAHAGREFDKGVNAIAALAESMQKLHLLNGQFPGLTLNLGRISGGGALNAVADLALCRFNVRSESVDGIHWLKNELQKVLNDLRQREGIKAELEGDFNRQPKPMTPALQKMFSLLSECGEQLDVSIKQVPTGGCCDGNNLSADGLPNIDTLGVRGGKIHTAEEFMVIESLTERAKLSFLFLQKLAREGQQIVDLKQQELCQ